MSSCSTSPSPGSTPPRTLRCQRLLEGWRERGRTVLVATHDLESAARDFDLVLCLNQPAGRLRPAREHLHRGGRLRDLRRPHPVASARSSSTPPTTITGRAEAVDWLVDPFQAEFVRTGALAAAAVGVICGVVGCYVILRGMALMADSLAHGVLPGVAIAFALTAGRPARTPNEAAIWIGALAAGLFTAGGDELRPAPQPGARGDGGRGRLRLHARAGGRDRLPGRGLLGRPDLVPLRRRPRGLERRGDAERGLRGGDRRARRPPLPARSCSSPSTRSEPPRSGCRSSG